jgi:hypothetical protein
VGGENIYSGALAVVSVTATTTDSRRPSQD